MPKIKRVMFFSFAAMLSGCGGGGGGDAAPQASVMGFPLQSAYAAFIAGGSATNYSVSGSCHGTATISQSAPSPAVFGGVSGASASQTVTITFTDCTPATNAVTTTAYYT